jgi:hypothetical protein
LTFSYFLEILRLPALADFTRALMKAFFGGDASEWERALLMPHYSAAGMPSCSLHQVRFARFMWLQLLSCNHEATAIIAQ